MELNISTKLAYTQAGDYLIPNIALAEFDGEIGRYGRMRRAYLKEHRPILFDRLVLSAQLYPHLSEINKAAEHRVQVVLPQMMEQRGVTEELKSADPMRWIQEMNAIQETIEEIIRRELSYEEDAVLACSMNFGTAALSLRSMRLRPARRARMPCSGSFAMRISSSLP